MFNQRTLQGAFFSFSSSSNGNNDVQWIDFRSLLKDYSIGTSPFISVSSFSSVILVRINDDAICTMIDEITNGRMMTCGVIPTTNSVNAVSSNTLNINAMAWSPFTNTILLPFNSNVSSIDTICNPTSVSASSAPWGFCGTQLASFSPTTLVFSACQEMPPSQSGIPFTKFDVATVWGDSSTVISTIPSVESPKRMFQIRQNGAQFLLLSLESLAFIGTAQFSSSSSSSLQQDRFSSACSENPPQVTWFLSLSNSSSTVVCTPKVLAETPFQVIIKNTDCTLSSIDVESGDILWTSLPSQKLVPSPEATTCFQSSSGQQVFTEAILIDYETKISFVEAASGDLKILNVSNGAEIRSIPNTPAVAHCLSNAINTGDPLFASASAATGFIHILAVTLDQSQTKVILVSTNTLIAGGSGSEQKSLVVASMAELLRFTFKPSPTWRRWNSFDSWRGILVVPGTLNRPNMAPLWSAQFQPEQQQQQQQQAPFQLILVDANWLASPIVVQLMNVNAVAVSRLSLLEDFTGVHLEFQNVNLLRTSIDVTICAPSPSFSFILNQVSQTQVNLLPNSNRVNCLSSGLVYAEFKITSSRLNTSYSSSSSPYAAWQNLFMSARQLILSDAQITGSLQKDLSPVAFSLRSTPLSLLDLSNNPRLSGYMFDQAWTGLVVLRLSNTDVQTSPSSSPYSFTTHLIPCDSHFRYALEEIDVSGCAGIRGIFAVSTGERSCLPISFTRIKLNGTSILDAIDLRITSNTSSSNFEQQHPIINIVVDPTRDLRQRKIRMVCGNKYEQIPSILIDSTLSFSPSNLVAWDPCNTTKDTPTSISRAPSFHDIEVIDATDSRLWLPMRPFCINITLSYSTGNYLPFTSGTSTKTLNNSGVLFQIYPSLVRADELSISIGGSPAKITDATVQARVNSFSSFQSAFRKHDIRCGIVPLHWWLVAEPAVNQNNNATDDLTTPQIVDLVFAEAIRSNLTSCLTEVLMFELYQPSTTSNNNNNGNTPTSSTTFTSSATTTITELTATSTTDASFTTSPNENSTTTTSSSTLSSASSTIVSSTSTTLLPSSTTVPSQIPENGGGGATIDIRFTLGDLVLQVVYLPIVNGSSSASTSSDPTNNDNNNNNNQQQQQKQRSLRVTNNYDAQIIINATAVVTEKNLTSNMTKTFNVSFTYTLDDDAAASSSSSSSSCPATDLLLRQGYCLVETPPTYHRVDFFPQWINMSTIETGTNPSQLNCSLPNMQVTVLSDGRVYPWAASQDAQGLCAPKQFSLSGLIRNCSLYPDPEEEDTLYCLGFATDGSVRRSTYSVTFCTLHWTVVPLCEASREVAINLLNGAVSLFENFFKSVISGNPSSTVYAACSVDTHSSEGVGVAGFVRVDKCEPLSAIFPPPYKQLDPNIQRSDLQELLQACVNANQCSFYDETTGQLVCDLVSSKLRLLALCFAVRGYNVSVAENVLRKITTVIAQNCSVNTGAVVDPNDVSSSRYYRETVGLFSLSVENIFVKTEYDQLHDMTHFIWCNPTPNGTDSGASSTTALPAPPLTLTSSTTSTTTTTTHQFFTTSTTTTPPPFSTPENTKITIPTLPVVWSFPNRQCISGIRITTSMCSPYIEPHVFPLSYTSFIFAAVKDIILMVIGVGLFSISFVRVAFGRFFARFLFNLAPFYQDEKEEWLEKFAKRVAPRTITIDEVTDNFKALIADPETMGFVPSLGSFNRKPTGLLVSGELSGGLGSNDSNENLEANLKSLLFLQRSSLDLIDHHSSVANLTRVTAAAAAAPNATDSLTTALIKPPQQLKKRNSLVSSQFIFRKTKGSLLLTSSDDDDDTTNDQGSSVIINGNNNNLNTSPNSFVFDSNTNSKKWIGGLPQTNKLWIEFGTANRAMSALAQKLQTFFHRRGGLGGSLGGQPRRRIPNVHLGVDGNFIRTGLTNDESLHEDADAVKHYDPKKQQQHEHNTLTGFDVVSSLNGESRTALDRDSTLEEDEKQISLVVAAASSKSQLQSKLKNNDQHENNNNSSNDKIQALDDKTTTSDQQDEVGTVVRSYSPPVTNIAEEQEQEQEQEQNKKTSDENQRKKVENESNEVQIKTDVTNSKQNNNNNDDAPEEDVHFHEEQQQGTATKTYNVASWAPPLNNQNYNQQIRENNNNNSPGNSNNKPETNLLDDANGDNNDNHDDRDENPDTDLGIVHRDDFHLFERIILLRGKQLVKNTADPEVKKKFTTLLFVWGKHDSHKLRFGLRKMNKKEQKAMQSFLEVAQFEDTVLELDMIKWRFTPQIWLMVFQFLFCVAYYIVCIVQVLSTRKGDTVWNQYQSMMFRFINSCTPIMLLTNSMLRRFYKEDLRPDFFFYSPLVMMSPAIITHIIPAIFIYFWVVVLAMMWLMATFFIGEFFRKHGREVLHGFVARSNAPASSSSPLSSPAAAGAAGSFSKRNPIPLVGTIGQDSNDYQKYDQDNDVGVDPASPLDVHDRKVNNAAAASSSSSASPQTASQIAAQNTNTATIVSCVIYIIFRILITLCVAVLLQTLFNYAVLFYDRESLDLSYGDVVNYEWNSRTIKCPTWASGFGIANTLQLLSFLF